MTSTRTAPLPRSHDQTPRLTFAGIVQAESTKLTSVRSTWLLALLAIGLAAAAGAAVAATELTSPADAVAGGVATTLRTMAPASTVVALFVAVIAVLFVTQEFTSGQIRTTYAAVPTRLPILGAKTVVAAGTALVLSILSSIAAWAGSSLPLSTAGLRTSLFEPTVLQNIAASAAWLVILTIFTVMISTITRSPAGAIAIVLGVLFVLPVAAVFVSRSSSADLSVLLLTYAETTMSQLFSGTESATDLGRDLGVLAAWLGAPTAVAAWTTKRRDV